MHAMGRNFNTDHYGYLRVLLERARGDWGLSKICREAGCESGRGTIRNWLDGRPRNLRHDEDDKELVKRWLPPHIARPLLRWIGEHYLEEATKLYRELVGRRP